MKERLPDLSTLLLRLGFGGLMLSHGIPKLLSWSEKADSWADPIGVGPTASLALAIFAEVFCSLGVMAGVLTRLAVIPLIVTMLVAVLVVHADDPFGRKELGLLYLLAYLAIAVAGPGRFSFDHWFRSRRKKR